MVLVGEADGDARAGESNIIGQSVTLYREEVRERVAAMTDYFFAHGVSDPAAAQHQAMVALGRS